ncbi:MAG: cupin domain-containing protein [Candidatus Pacebacteria bacterium]|nr:cupin domain-containing protein [Candidatus Paceibacterota bacterium]
MKIIHKNQAEIHENSDVCSAIEYPSDDKDINGAVIELSGRYPDKGRTVNLECKEMAYIIKGSGELVIEDKEIKLDEGDLILIDKGEKYFWNGNLTMFISCMPAWYHEQHKKVK